MMSNVLARFLPSTQHKVVPCKEQGFKDNEWVLEYRCAKSDCTPIAESLSGDGWIVYRQVHTSHTYKAIKSDPVSDVIKYYEEFEQKPEIITASVYPSKINSGKT